MAPWGPTRIVRGPVLAVVTAVALVGCTDGTDADKDGDTASDSDTGRGVQIDTPTIAFANPSPVTSDDLVVSVTDPDPAASYRYAWRRDGTLIDDVAAPTLPAARTRKGQRWTAEVRADVGGVSSSPATASVTIGNSPPSITAITLDPAAPSSAEDVYASATITDPDPEDSDAWDVSWTWQQLEGGTRTQPGEFLSSSYTQAGDRWKIVGTPNDGDDDGEPMELEFDIENAVPVVNSVTLSPGQPLTSTTLTATISASDADGGGAALALTVEWYVDSGSGGQLVETDAIHAASGAPTLAPSAFSKGDSVWVVVTPDDGIDTGTAFQSPSLTIGNTPPQSDGSSITVDPAGDVTEASTLTCTGSGFADVDGDAAGWQWVWYRGGVPISGAVSETLTGDDFSKGQVVTCEAVPFDGTLTGLGTPSSGLTVRNTPPVVGSIGLSPSEPAIDGSITATPLDAFDADQDPILFRWTWTVEAEVRKTETGAVSTLNGPFLAGDRVEVSVVPDDLTTQGTPAVGSVVVANTPPAIDSLTVVPDPQTGDDTTLYGDVAVRAVATASDADDQPVTIRYIWTKIPRVGSAQVVQSGSDPVLDPLHFRSGDKLRVEAIPNDGREDGDSVLYGPVDITNRLPSVQSVTLAALDGETPITRADALLCTASLVDADGDSPIPDYRWVIDDLLSDVIGNVIPANTFPRGTSIVCRVCGKDQEQVCGPTADSNEVVLANTVPSITGAVLSTVAPAAGETVSVTPQGWSDADGDPEGYRYQWQVNEVDVSTAATLAPSFFASGDRIRVRVTPYDGFDEGEPVWSGDAVGSNANPSITRFELLPETPGTEDDLVVEWEATDGDTDDVLEPAFTWYLNEVVQADVDGDTFPSDRTQRGHSVRAKLVVTDGRGGFDEAEKTVAIANTRPTLDGGVWVTGSDERITVDDQLTCNTGTWYDPDGEAPNYVYSWRKVGGTIPIGSGKVLSGGFARGESVYCEVRLVDFGGSGDPIPSEPVEVLNAAPTVISASLDLEQAQEMDVVTATAIGLDDVDVADTPTITWVWFVEGVEVFTGEALTGEHFDKGDAIYARAVPTDGTDEGDWVETEAILAVNTAPIVSNVVIAPAEARVADELTATWEQNDPDPADTVFDATLSWTVQGVPVQSGSSTTLPAGTAKKNQTVFVSVQVEDPDGAASTPRGSLGRTILNTVPTLASATITPEEIRIGSVPTCETSGFADADEEDPEQYRYQWYVNGATAGAQRTLSAVQFKKGDVLRCVAWPSDGDAEGTSVESATTTVLNTNPTIALVQLTSFPTVVNEKATLTATPSTISDVDIADRPGLAVTYRWFNGEDEIVGHTANTITGALFDKGDEIWVRATVSDGTGTASVDSVRRLVVNTPPEVTSAVLTPASPRYRDDMTVTATWKDDDPADAGNLVVDVQWVVNGSIIDDISGFTLPSGYAKKYQTIRATVRVDDLEVASPSLRQSNTVEMINTLPTLDAVVIIDGARDDGEGNLIADRNQGLTCEAQGGHDDDPDDPVNVAYQWRVDGQNRGAGSFLAATQYVRGQVVTCTATPNDNDQSGVAVTSDEVTIVNAPPVVSLFQLDTTAPTRAENVEVDQLTVTDPDPSDNPGWTIRWYVDGGFVYNGPTLYRTDFARGQTIEARVTPEDDTEEGEVVSSGVFTVGNAPPEFGGPAQVLPEGVPGTEMKTRERAWASVSVTDPDEDDLEITWSWRVNGSEVLSGTRDVLDGDTFFDKGDKVTLVATAKDIVPGDASAEVTITSGVSAEVLVVDSLPSIPHVTWTQGYPSGGAVIACQIIAGGRDDDGDLVEFDWELQAGDVSFFDYQDGSYGEVRFGSDELSPDLWQCRARAYNLSSPNDYTEFGPSSFMYPYQVINQTCAEATDDGRPPVIDVFDHDADYTTPPFRAYCDTTVARAGGGWTRVMRTTGNNDDVGQRGTGIAFINSESSGQTGPLVWEGFLRHDSFTEVMIVQTTGGQSGRWRRFAFDESPNESLYHLLAACRDEAIERDDDTVFGAVTAVGHTAQYSAEAVDGTLQWFDATGAAHDLEYFSVCGVNRSDDNDVSYLAFHTQALDNNDYGDGWRGLDQAGTLWSFANGNYSGPLDTHIGGPGLQTLAGWRGTASAQALKHQGTYTIYVR